MPNAFLRSFGLVVVAVVAVVTGAPTAQAQTQEQEQTERLAPLVDTFNVFAGQLAEICFNYMNITDDGLRPMRDATCGLTTADGREAVNHVVTSFRPGELQERLYDLPEDSWRGESFTGLLENEDEILRSSSSSAAARALSLHRMIAHRERSERSGPGGSEGLFSAEGRRAMLLSPEGAGDAVDSLCRRSPVGDRHPAERARWVWAAGKFVGGLVLIGVNTAIAPGLPPWAAMSAALGGTVLASGYEDLEDL